MSNLYAQHVPTYTQDGAPSCAGHRETPLVDGQCPRCLAGKPPVKEAWFMVKGGSVWHFLPEHERTPQPMLVSACDETSTSGYYFDRFGDKRVDSRPDGRLCPRCLRAATREQLK